MTSTQGFAPSSASIVVSPFSPMRGPPTWGHHSNSCQELAHWLMVLTSARSFKLTSSSAELEPILDGKVDRSQRVVVPTTSVSFPASKYYTHKFLKPYRDRTLLIEQCLASELMMNPIGTKFVYRQHIERLHNKVCLSGDLQLPSHR